MRSLLILIVMMFLAIAMSCDDNIAASPSKGAIGCVGGFLFAVVVTEGVLHTIRLRLPGWYRVAYYLILALVFRYPIAVIPLLGDPENPTLQWAIFAFAPLAGLAVASLVPAARHGLVPRPARIDRMESQLQPVGSTINSAAWLGHAGVRRYTQLRTMLAGLDQITWGVVFFLVAMTISLRKAGIWPRSVWKPLGRIVKSIVVGYQDHAQIAARRCFKDAGQRT